jgi:hypothetical protein
MKNYSEVQPDGGHIAVKWLVIVFLNRCEKNLMIETDITRELMGHDVMKPE